MGHIYKQIGRFSIEGRRESFYIHADYGLKPLEKRLGDLELGQRYKTTSLKEAGYVVGHMIGGITLVRPLPEEVGERVEINSNEIVILIDKNGDPSDHMEDDHPLGPIWREHPHPEIEISDLGDLIAVLENYRESLGAR